MKEWICHCKRPAWTIYFEKKSADKKCPVIRCRICKKKYDRKYHESVTTRRDKK